MAPRMIATVLACLTTVGLACGAALVAPAKPARSEPVPAADSPAGESTHAAGGAHGDAAAVASDEGSAAGRAGAPATGRVDRSAFIVEDASDDGLARPAGAAVPSRRADAGLPEALARAERLFAEARLAEAADLYEAVAASPDTEAAAYARYKLAWCRYNLQEYQAALQALIEVRARVRVPATDQERILRREAGRDLPLFYAPVGLPEQALPFFRRVLDADEVFAALQRLEEHYRSEGRDRDAGVVREALCHLRPEHGPSDH